MDSEADTTMIPFAENIITHRPHGNSLPDLLGGFCSACDDYFFPAPAYCPKCLGNTRICPIGNRGSIYSFTVVRTPPLFDLPSPYGVGYIDLKKTGLRVFSLLDPEALDRLKIGAQVILSVKPLGRDNQGFLQLRPCFILDPVNEHQKN